MNELFRRLQYLFNRGRREWELADEMEFHREMAAREGNDGFGNTLRLREEAREAWGWTWIDRLMQDLRFAMRQLRKTPGFTLAAVLMLAIGIGINVAAFGFFNLVYFKPLPVREPGSLLRFHRLAHENYSSDLAYPAMEFYREHTKTLSAVLAMDVGQLMMDGAGEPLRTHFVTANFFSELGAGARLGRLFDPLREEGREAPPVAVLGHEFWKRQFGGDMAVTGRTIRLGGKQVQVIGVAARDFCGFTMQSPDVWLPLQYQPHFVEGSQLLTSYSADTDGVDMWGRLRPGVTAKAAEAELRSLTAELRRQHPKEIWENESLLSEPGGYPQNAGGKNRGTGQLPGLRTKLAPIFALMAALSLLILAVACGNLGSLLLARGVARQREISIRVAVGAGSGRLIRQLLTESFVMGLMGSAAGLGLGYAVLRSMMVWTEAPAWMEIAPDWRVVAFTLGMGLAAVVLFGLTPALQIARQRQRATITRQFLIGAQVAASCVLLIVAGLLVRALDHAVSGDPGFEYKQVILIDPRLANHGFSAGGARTHLDSLQGRLRGMAGIESVSLAASPPLGNRATTENVEKDGQSFVIYVNRVDPEFFQTMKIPLLRGRNFAAGETKAVIVSESLARRQWPGEDPLEKTFTLGGAKYPVAGVAGNARALALADSDAVEAYLPIDEAGLPSLAVMVRASGRVEDVAPAVASLARSIDPRVTPSVQTLKSAFARRIDGTERASAAVSVLGLTALLLACLGVVGVVSFAVSQRTREIGIRMALGAKASHVLVVVLRQFASPVAAGLLVGVSGAAALSQLLRRELYGISNLDPVAYLAAVSLFAAAAGISALLPARSALRVDPMRALRHD